MSSPTVKYLTHVYTDEEIAGYSLLDCLATFYLVKNSGTQLEWDNKCWSSDGSIVTRRDQ